MKKVLIIGFLHPFTRSGGSFRPLPLAKHLPEFGWEPVILTPFLLEKTELQFRVIETPYRDVLGFWKKLFGFNPDEDIKRQVKGLFGTTSKDTLIDLILTRIGEIVNYPDQHRGWKSFAIREGKDLIQRENINAIISCHPVTSHIIASNLKKKFGIPWIADFADLWSQNHNYGYSQLRRLVDRRLELKTLSHVNALITVSLPWAEKLRASHKEKSVYVITHGFDPEEVNEPPIDLTTKFTITYTGTIYIGKQDLSTLFAALRELISEGIMNPDKVWVRFYGPKIGWLDNEIDKYRLSSIIKQYGRVPRQIAIEKQRESQILLLLNWEDSQEHGVYPGKVFEYLAAQRPILATGGFGNDVIKELLDETKSGIYCKTVEDIKSFQKELYSEYKLKGEIIYNGDIEKINKYSHREMARKFAGVLDQVTSK